MARAAYVERLEKEGRIIDGMTLRIKLIRLMEAGMITLDEVQGILKQLAKDAKKLGLHTRHSAWMEGKAPQGKQP